MNIILLRTLLYFYGTLQQYEIEKLNIVSKQFLFYLIYNFHFTLSTFFIQTKNK